MNEITVRYHREDGSWWVESDSLPGFSALALSYGEAKRMLAEHLVAEGLSGALVIELLDEVTLRSIDRSVRSTGASWWSFSQNGVPAIATGRARYGKQVTAVELVDA